MQTRPFVVHALSAVHAGTGQAVGTIDLPIARMCSTGIPIVPGSSIKGVLKDTCRSAAGCDTEALFAVFGPDTDNAAEHAGALMVGDCRLLALPVRSFRGTFAWVSSPLLLALARRDLALAGAGEQGQLPPLIEPFAGCGVRVACAQGAARCANIHGDGGQARVYLEDLDLPVMADGQLSTWAALLAGRVASEQPDVFAKRFVVADDETMAFLWETATQVDARVRLDPNTRTVASKALWYEESLPPETLLIGVATADKSRRSSKELKPTEVLDFAMGKEAVLQFGGKASVGRGLCRLIPLS